MIFSFPISSFLPSLLSRFLSFLLLPFILYHSLHFLSIFLSLLSHHFCSLMFFLHFPLLLYPSIIHFIIFTFFIYFCSPIIHFIHIFHHHIFLHVLKKKL